MFVDIESRIEIRIHNAHVLWPLMALGLKILLIHLLKNGRVIGGTCWFCCVFNSLMTKPFDSLNMTPHTLAADSANRRLTWQIQ